jgi:hypothetical protein
MQGIARVYKVLSVDVKGKFFSVKSSSGAAEFSNLNSGKIFIL